MDYIVVLKRLKITQITAKNEYGALVAHRARGEFISYGVIEFQTGNNEPIIIFSRQDPPPPTLFAVYMPFRGKPRHIRQKTDSKILFDIMSLF